MFASQITKVVKLPTVKPAPSVTIRALSGRAKERAQQATLGRAARMHETVGGAKVFAEIQKMGEARVRGTDTDDDGDKSSSYDKQTTLVEGIVSWTAKAEVTPDTIADLEADVADLVFREILILSRVPVTAADVKAQEHDRKNA